MDLDDARRFALALPEVVEGPHHAMTSFRVRGKIFAIFATAPPDGGHLHVFVDEHETRAAVAAGGAAYAELWWGKRLSGLRVTLAAANPTEVRELIELAWRRKAPRGLVTALDRPDPQTSSGVLPAGRPAAVDRQDHPVDQSGGVGQQVGDGVGHSSMRPTRPSGCRRAI
jgi:hypothetical protein